ncbi:carboxypeptidase M-like [Artemia franciscana]|uniref:carboxypeptidase M-like n=1 Tax=Artemia franciscana TaxID=6661 RepID=UPI0032DA031A
MKLASLYTSAFVVVFVYLYCYLIQHVRGAEIPEFRKFNVKPSFVFPNEESIGRVISGPPPLNAILSDVRLQPLEFRYHNYDELTQYLQEINAQYPHITSFYSIGKSIQGRDLWVLMLSTEPNKKVVLKPNVKYVGGIHGNEPVGRELMLHLIQYLVVNYQSDPYVRWLLDNTRVHILPAMNPDGFEVAKEGDCHGAQGRYNIRGYDLNRNFPDYFRQNTRQIQPEAEAIQNWLKQTHFVVSGGLHGGALVASYPFDNKPAQALEAFSSYSSSLTSDNDIFEHLATTFSFNHRTMHLGKACRGDRKGFTNGTTNGAEWYYLTGGMQDFNYIWHGVLEVTFELSCCKYPPASQLESFWEDNKKALLQYLGEAHRGIRGIISDENGQPIPKTSVKVSGRDVGMQTTPLGEYWRVLLPGNYLLEVYKEGFEPREIPFAIQEGIPAVLNVTLRRDRSVGSPSAVQKLSSIQPQEPHQSGNGFFNRFFSFFG